MRARVGGGWLYRNWEVCVWFTTVMGAIGALASATIDDRRSTTIDACGGGFRSDDDADDASRDGARRRRALDI